MNRVTVLFLVFIFVYFSCSSIKKTQSQLEYDPVMQQDRMPGSESEAMESIEIVLKGFYLDQLLHFFRMLP